MFFLFRCVFRCTHFRHFSGIKKVLDTADKMSYKGFVTKGWRLFDISYFMEANMTYLAVHHIRKAIANDPRFDPNIELDEPGKAIVWLADGYTWDKLDGNRSVEGFIIAADNSDQQPRDTVAYWKQCVSNIEKI